VKTVIRAAAAIAACLFWTQVRADEAFVTNQSSDDLTIVDLATMKSVATLPIGGKPAGVAVAPDGSRACVTSPEGKYLSLIDARARRVVKKIPVEGGPFGVAFSPEGLIYVADMFGRRLIEIDPDSEKRREVAVGAMPSGVAPTPDGRFVVVADRDDNALSIVDAVSFTRVAVIPVGRHPFGVTVDAKGRRAYTANVESDDVSVVDLATRQLVATIPVGKRPYSVALAQGRGFVADQYGESVSVFDESALKPVSQIKVGEYPESVAASRDGSTVYVTNWFSNELWSIDAKSLDVVAKVATGDGPRAFGAFIRTISH
jgi:YVTN family beta-propeller protein